MNELLQLAIDNAMYAASLLQSLQERSEELDEDSLEEILDSLAESQKYCEKMFALIVH